jgi:hypothetical protein
MPEISLGIGRDRLIDDPFDREVLTWYDARGRRYRSEAEVERDRAAAERQRAATERQRADRLAARLRELGIDPEAIG